MPSEGKVVENYQGKFAKVIAVKNGMVHLSAWVSKKENAEVETVAVGRLNEFGLSQVLKGGKNAPKAEEKADKEPKGAGTDSKAVAIEKMTVPQLQKYAEFLEIETTGKKPELVERITAFLQAEVAAMEDLVVKQSDLDANPAFAEFGIKVGDTIQIPKAK